MDNPTGLRDKRQQPGPPRGVMFAAGKRVKFLSAMFAATEENKIPITLY